MTERQRELLKTLEQATRKVDAAAAKLEQARQARDRAIFEAFHETDLSVTKLAKTAKVSRQSIYNILDAEEGTK